MTDRKISIEQQSRFQFYLVALTFTVLGLAIQTAPPEGPVVALCAEIIGWIVLLASGLAGLSHLEWSPTTRVSMANRDDLFNKLQELRKAAQDGQKLVLIIETGEQVPIQERIKDYESYVETLDQYLAVLDRKASIKYQILKWCFVIGVVALGVSRGASIALEIKSAIDI